MVAVAGCGSSGTGGAAPSAASTPTASATPSASYPVTVTNCGLPVTYTKAPTRAVSNDINTTEDMLALGLESRMVGTFGVTGDGPVGQPVPAQYLAGFHQVRDVSSDYFTKEELVGLHPDFLFAGWDYGLQTGTSLTPQGLAQFGIKTLALTESCLHVQKGVTTISIADTYQDLRNLGEIFNIRAKAQHVISAMRAQIAAAQAKIAGLKPVTVFDYDSGQAAPFTGAGLATPTALIGLGGGTSIFAGLKQSFTSVSWEQVIKAGPQCIIINDYGTPTAAQKEKFLETSPITKNLTAVQNRCFLPLSYDEVTPGPRNSQAVAAIARWLHPAAFGLPADGS
jgi:iron complex transport system substrate-binding protein